MRHLRLIFCAVLLAAATGSAMDMVALERVEVAPPGTFQLPIRHVLLLAAPDDPEAQAAVAAWARHLPAQLTRGRVTTAGFGWVQGPDDPPPELVVIATGGKGAPWPDAFLDMRLHAYTMAQAGLPGMRGGLRYRIAHTEGHQSNHFELHNMLIPFQLSRGVLPADLADLLTPEFSGPERVDWPEELPFELLWSSAAPGCAAASVYRMPAAPEDFAKLAEAARKFLDAAGLDDVAVAVDDLAPEGVTRQGAEHGDTYLYLRLARVVDVDAVLLAEIAARQLEAELFLPLVEIYPPETVAALLDGDLTTRLRPAQISRALELPQLSGRRRFLTSAWLRRDSLPDATVRRLLELDAAGDNLLPPEEIAAYLGPEIDGGAECELQLHPNTPPLRWHRREDDRLALGRLSMLNPNLLLVEESGVEDHCATFLSPDRPARGTSRWSFAADFSGDGAILLQVGPPEASGPDPYAAIRQRITRQPVNDYPYFSAPFGAFTIPARHLLLLLGDDAPWTRRFAGAWAEKLRRDDPGLLVTVAPAGWLQPEGTPPPDIVNTVATVAEQDSLNGHYIRFELREYENVFTWRHPERSNVFSGVHTRRSCDAELLDDFSDAEAELLARMLVEKLFGVETIFTVPPPPPLPADLVDLLTPEFAGPDLVDWPEELPFELVYAAAAPGRAAETVYQLPVAPERFEALAEEARMAFYARPDNDGLLLIAETPPGKDKKQLLLRLVRPVDVNQLLLDEFARRGLTARYFSTLTKCLPPERLTPLLNDSELLAGVGIEQLQFGLYGPEIEGRDNLFRHMWSRRGEATFLQLFNLLRAAAERRWPLPPDEVAGELGTEFGDGDGPREFILTPEQPEVRWHRQAGELPDAAMIEFRDGSPRLELQSRDRGSQLTLDSPQAARDFGPWRIEIRPDAENLIVTVSLRKE